MPSRVSGLTFRDRVAARPDGKLVFRCTGTGHKPITRTVEGTRKLKALIADHDREYHENDATAADAPRHEPLGPLLKRYLDDRELQWRDNVIREDTLDYYRDRAEALLSVWPRSKNTAALTQEDVNSYVAVRREGRRGKSRRDARAAIRRDLEFLRTVVIWAGIAPKWKVPSRKAVGAPVRPKPKRQPSAEELSAFLNALPLGSVVRGFVIAKLFTGLRDEELYAANVGDVVRNADGSGALPYRERAKQSEEMRTAVLLPIVMEAIAPLMAGQTPETPLFRLRGRRLAKQRLRYPLVKASETAGIDPPITSTSFLRARYATLAFDILGARIGLVSQSLEHRNTATTERHYLDHTRDKSRIKQLVSRAVEKAVTGRKSATGASKTPPKSGTILSNVLKRLKQARDS